MLTKFNVKLLKIDKITYSYETIMRLLQEIHVDAVG